MFLYDVLSLGFDFDVFFLLLDFPFLGRPVDYRHSIPSFFFFPCLFLGQSPRYRHFILYTVFPCKRFMIM